MRRIVWIWMMLCAMCLQAQTVTNVVAEQIGNTVVIRYDLDKAASVSLLLSRDGGDTYFATPKAVTGDVGNTSAGRKRMIWNLLADSTDWDIEKARFKLVATDNAKPSFTINGVSFTMIAVEGGTFTMGTTYLQDSEANNDEMPIHSVTLSDYYIGQTEVTQGLWKAVMGTNIRQQCDKKDYDCSLRGEGNDYPMYNINWEECQQFVNKLNSMLSSQLDGKRFALPTEAQWEYAARGGKKSSNYKYSGSNVIDDVAWYIDNSSFSTHLVATKAPNELGLYDMSGNVWEWCLDWYGKYCRSSQTNPQGPSSGYHRVYRGGSWGGNDTRFCRVTYRGNFCHPVSRDKSLGFRLVLQ